MLTPTSGESDFGWLVSWPVRAVDVYGNRTEVVVGLIERHDQVEVGIRVGEFGMTAALPTAGWRGKDHAVELSTKLRDAIAQRMRSDHPGRSWGG